MTTRAPRSTGRDTTLPAISASDLHHPFALGPAPRQHQEAGAGLRPDHLGPHLVDRHWQGRRPIATHRPMPVIALAPVAKTALEPSQSSRTAAMIDADMIFLTYTGTGRNSRMRSHSGGVAV